MPDEEFGAGGDELRGFGAEEGFGEGGHAGRVVRYECGCGAKLNISQSKAAVIKKHENKGI